VLVELGGCEARPERRQCNSTDHGQLGLSDAGDEIEET
jgi:hypothetical protein